MVRSHNGRQTEDQWCIKIKEAIFLKYSLNDAGNKTSVRERNRQRKEKKKVKNMDGEKDYLAKK